MMVTAHDDEDYLMEALKAGASGYILKHAPPSQISTAVRKALEGEFPLNRDLTTRLLRRLAHEMRESEGSRLPEKPTSPLTAREIEVLRLLAKGNTNRDIARELVISLGTAKNHVQHIIAKLEVADRTQAAVKAIELRLL
jgi:DNA-binding NarL/FixJ family response regulator